MDIKLKSNKENHKSNDSISDLKKDNYKSKGIITTLVIITIIILADLGMCNSYGFVNEAANSKN